MECAVYEIDFLVAFCAPRAARIPAIPRFIFHFLRLCTLEVVRKNKGSKVFLGKEGHGETEGEQGKDTHEDYSRLKIRALAIAWVTFHDSAAPQFTLELCERLRRPADRQFLLSPL